MACVLWRSLPGLDRFDCSRPRPTPRWRMIAQESPNEAAFLIHAGVAYHYMRNGCVAVQSHA